jgi:hypothetical protein
LEHRLKRVPNMHLNPLRKMMLAEVKFILVYLSGAVSCLALFRKLNLFPIKVYEWLLRSTYILI